MQFSKEAHCGICAALVQSLVLSTLPKQGSSMLNVICWCLLRSWHGEQLRNGAGWELQRKGSSRECGGLLCNVWQQARKLKHREQVDLQL